MTSRARRLRRLLGIRRIGEEIERRRLQSVLGSAAEAEAALTRQQQAISAAAEASYSALGRGDRGEWLFAEAQNEAASSNRARLIPVLQSRQLEVAPATSAFLDRHREHEQVQHLIREDLARQQLVDARKAQAAADDWFLARRIRNRR